MSAGSERSGVRDPVPEPLRGDTLAQAASVAANDPGQAQRIAHLCTLIRLERDPEGLRGEHAAAMAPRLGAPAHLVVVAIARLTGRDVLEVVSEVEPMSPLPAPALASLSEQRRARRRALGKLQEREAFKPTGEADLDRLVASMGSFAARAAARLIEPLVGDRDPGELRSWERGELVAAGGCEELVEQGLRLLGAIRARPHIRAAWERWRHRLDPPADRHASPPPGPPDRRCRHRGEREMGELRRRIERAREVPVPCVQALRWPVIRDRNAQPDPDTGLYTFRDMLGEVACSFKPTVRCLRWMLGAALVLREADHHPNPSGEGRRTVFISYNALSLAASGRDCQGEEYDAIDAWLFDMVTGQLEASDDGAEKRKRSYELHGTPIEDAYIRVQGGEVMRFADWHELPAERRPGRLRGSGPTLMLTFTEDFYAAVMTRAGHFLLSKQTAWAARDELVTLLRIESHTGVQRSSDAWELFAAPPFLRQVGFHGSDQRACELLVEDDLHAIEEVWAAVSSVAVGDSKKGYAWLSVNLNRRGECGRRPEATSPRTRTRQQRRHAWATERPERLGRRRTFAPAGAPGRATLRREATARKLLAAARAADANARRAKPSSRRRHNARHRARVRDDLAAAARARQAT